MKLGYKYGKALLLAMVLVLSLLVAGCDQQKESKDSSSGSGQAQVETSAETKQAANDLITEVNVYFPDENATGLFPERKSVKATDKSKYKAAMEALMAGPKDKRLTSVMPGKTQLLWVKMDKDTALMTSTGSAICGAAAVLGAEPVVKCEGHKTAIAVSTVVIFGTISMFLYPIL